MKSPLHITSEIGTLKTVLLHRPGKELENLTPTNLERLLFDDIPYLPIIQKEHDYFANALQTNGVEVIYLEKLMTEVLDCNNGQHREPFVEKILNSSKTSVDGAFPNIKEYLLSLSNKELVKKVMSGVRKHEVEITRKKRLFELMADYYPFYLDPMPNLYFTRDPAAVIGDGITINRMKEHARRRESIFMEYIIQHHPRFCNYNIPILFDRNYRYALEGGDELVLSESVIAIGVSSRTSPQAIEKLAINIFNSNSGIKKVLAMEIPDCRAFMHLDTVFTMVDYDKFTMHTSIVGPEGNMRIFILEKGTEVDSLTISERSNLKETLKEVLELDDVLIIPCGGGDEIASEREQWNDGSNTLAISPGVVVTYDRNYISNELLRENGIKVIEVLSSELSRGRGGPRCMSMPIVRDDLKK